MAWWTAVTRRRNGCKWSPGGVSRLLEDGLAESDLRDDPLGHGSAVIEAIGRRAPSAVFCVAQVFDQRGVTSALQIATAIDWLVAQDVRLINLSLGLRQDRSLLRERLRGGGGAGHVAVRVQPGPGRRACFRRIIHRCCA